MTLFRKLSLMLTLSLMVTFSAWAQDDYEMENRATTWYADRCEVAIDKFMELRKNPFSLPQKYVMVPDKSAAPLGYAMAIANTELTEIVLYTPKGNGLNAKNITSSQLPNEEVYWIMLSELGTYRTHDTDITLKERPIPIRQVDMARNRYEACVEDFQPKDIARYTQMFFKPHRNTVKMIDKHEVIRKNVEGVVIDKSMLYTFALATPAVRAKMFRGYDNNEAAPWVVKNSFFDNHILLQYTRWKEGEPEKKASRDAIDIISRHYGGRRIKSTRWLATAETAERTFYAVQFEHKGTHALAALVCVAEGEVVSTWEFHGDLQGNDANQSIWFVDDEGDFLEHAPEIHAMVATPEGLELYVRVYGGESVQYYVLREMGPVLMQIQADYWIYVWD